MRKLVVIVLIAAALALGLWWFLGRDGAGPLAGGIAADAPLDFAPADTPYVFANIEPLPEAERRRWMEQMDGVATIWRTQLDSMKTRMALDADPDMAHLTKWLDALEAEFADKTPEQVMATLGTRADGLFAMYGIGLAPVVRMEIADPDALRATVARLEQRTGDTFPAATLGDVGYWYFDIPDTTLRLIAAIHGKHLVLTTGPATDEAALRSLLGLERPSRTLRDSGTLQALNKTYGYLPIGSGYVDSARIADVLTSPATPLETALLATTGITKPTVDPACKTEAALLATLVPRFSGGYTRLEAGHMDMVSRIDTLPSVATDLQSLRTPMPGPRAGNTSVFDVGFGFKAASLPAVLNRWADAAQAQTFACPQLTWLNDTATELRTGASNPGIYTMAPVFSAVRLLVTRADLQSLQSGAPDGSAQLLIASGNPAALLSMAQTFAPEVSAMNLQPDGKVVALPTLAAAPLPLPVFASMNPQLLALGVGADQETALASAMTLDTNWQPLMVYGVDGSFYAEFMQFGMAQAALAATTDEERKDAEEMGALMREIYGKWIKRIDVTVDVDNHGLVIEQKMQMP